MSLRAADLHDIRSRLFQFADALGVAHEYKSALTRALAVIRSRASRRRTGKLLSRTFAWWRVDAARARRHDFEYALSQTGSGRPSALSIRSRACCSDLEKQNAVLAQQLALTTDETAKLEVALVRMESIASQLRKQVQDGEALLRQQVDSRRAAATMEHELEATRRTAAARKHEVEESKRRAAAMERELRDTAERASRLEQQLAESAMDLLSAREACARLQSAEERRVAEQRRLEEVRFAVGAPVCLHCTAPQCTARGTAWHCTALHAALHCTRHGTALHCTRHGMACKHVNAGAASRRAPAGGELR